MTKPNENTCINLVNKYIVSDTNIWFRQKVESLIKIWTKFLGTVTTQQNRKKTDVSAIFLSYWIFSTRISLLSRTAPDTLIAMTGKEVSYSHISKSNQIRHAYNMRMN